MKTKHFILGGTIIVILFFVIYTICLLAKHNPIEVQGEVEATQMRVASKLLGRIDSLPIHKGQDIKKGDLLFWVNSPEVDAKFEQANASKEAADAQAQMAEKGTRVEDIQAANTNYLKAMSAYELAQKTFKRINNLFKEGVVPEQKKDEAETQMNAAKETADGAKSQYNKALNGARLEDKTAAKALVRRAKGAVSEVGSYLKEKCIYAPISGEISNIIAERGELVPAGYPVVTIVDLKDIWVNFNLREDLLADIKKESIIVARFPALGNKEVKLKVSYINPMGNFATWNATKTSGDFDMKTFEVHATPIEMVEGLRPGMTALVNWEKLKQK